MQLTYKNNQIKKKLSSKYNINRYYSNCYRGVINRIVEFQTVDNLSCIRTTPPPCKHKLTGKYQGLWAVNVSKNFRLIFSIIDNKETDQSKITTICIEDIIDYH